MALTTSLTALAALRFAGGVASAFVIICASSLVLERLASGGRSGFASLHFAGVGAGIVISAALVAFIVEAQAGWIAAWLGSGLVAALTALAAAALIPAQTIATPAAKPNPALAVPAIRMAPMVVAYGFFGFGYVITSTFIVTLVRQSPDIRVLEPWIWMLFGLSAMPSVWLWQQVGSLIGVTRAFAVACVVEAVGVSASVEWVTLAGLCVSAALLGGTFMGLTALGLVAGRAAGAGRPQRAIGLMTASFGTGQMIGPLLAGQVADLTDSLRAPTLMATAALLLAAILALVSSRRTTRNEDAPA
jgi:predicted MFS family arabinose efflux permease